jgi:OmpA-OmpF porin, OOP family
MVAKQLVRRSTAVALLMPLLLLLGGLSISGGAALAQPKGSPETFIVYFPKGGTKVTSIGQQTVARALAAIAQAKAKGNYSHVKVIGYSAGLSNINEAQHVAEDRAAAVRDALVHAGVPSGEINTEGRAKLESAATTADQLNQPRNRRARIMIYRPGD